MQALSEQTSALDESAYGQRLHDAEHLEAEAMCIAEYNARPTLFDLVLRLIHWDQE